MTHFSDRQHDAFANPAKAACREGEHYPAWNWQNNESFRSLHFAYADGSVHFIHDTIALPVYRALATIRGREVVPQP